MLQLRCELPEHHPLHPIIQARRQRPTQPTAAKHACIYSHIQVATLDFECRATALACAETSALSDCSGAVVGCIAHCIAAGASAEKEAVARCHAQGCETRGRRGHRDDRWERESQHLVNAHRHVPEIQITHLASERLDPRVLKRGGAGPDIVCTRNQLRGAQLVGRSSCQEGQVRTCTTWAEPPFLWITGLLTTRRRSRARDGTPIRPFCVSRVGVEVWSPPLLTISRSFFLRSAIRQLWAHGPGLYMLRCTCQMVKGRREEGRLLRNGRAHKPL